MKKKGFTLIELLAVIVILAIIALIAVPIVLGIINDSKNSSEKENINLYKSAVNNAIARKQLSESNFNPDTCNVKDKGDLECFANSKLIGIIKVEMNGQLPNDGIIRFENNKICEIEDLKINNNYYNLLTSGKIIIGKKPTDPGLYDEDYNLLASWDELVNNYGLNISYCYGSTGYSGQIKNIIDRHDELKNSKILIISNDVETIGCRALAYTPNLIKIIIPNSVKNIKENAFQGCTNLKSITIPSSVENIGREIFYGCTSLESIRVDESNLKFEDRNSNAIIEKNSNMLITGCKNTVIPNNVTSIRYAAFSGCTGLTSITIPSGVTSIGNTAFGNTGLTSIIIPSSVKEIGYGAFKGCNDLTSVTFENTDGWYLKYNDNYGTYKDEITVLDPTINAANLNNIYENYIWKKR